MLGLHGVRVCARRRMHSSAFSLDDLVLRLLRRGARVDVCRVRGLGRGRGLGLGGKRVLDDVEVRVVQVRHEMRRRPGPALSMSVSVPIPMPMAGSVPLGRLVVDVLNVL
jgi:hypothetical protein